MQIFCWQSTHPHAGGTAIREGAELTEISNMGVVLLSCITLNGTTRARAISSCSLLRTHWRSAEPFTAVIDSAACSSFTRESRNFFDHTRWLKQCRTHFQPWNGRRESFLVSGRHENSFRLGCGRELHLRHPIQRWQTVLPHLRHPQRHTPNLVA